MALHDTTFAAKWWFVFHIDTGLALEKITTHNAAHLPVESTGVGFIPQVNIMRNFGVPFLVSVNNYLKQTKTFFWN